MSEPRPARSVLIVGTSMAERPHDGVPAYPELLEERLGARWRIDRLIRGGTTIEDLAPDAINAVAAVPDVAVLHVGINDCGPRPLTRREREWLGRVRPLRLRARIIRFIHDHRARIIRLRGVKQFTGLAAFASRIDEVVGRARAAGTLVVVLPITRVPATAEIRQPFLNREADRYNDALQVVARRHGIRFVEREEILQGLTPEAAASAQDSVHLGAVAHRRIADVLVDVLETIEREPVPVRQNSG
jgi:lysophospholipase L1-like esterase